MGVDLKELRGGALAALQVPSATRDRYVGEREAYLTAG